MRFLLRSVYLSAFLHFLLYSQGERVPVWVDSTPTDDQYYHGTAKISIKKSDYIEKADDIALRQMSKQINTQVYSDSKREVNEVNDIATSKYENKSRLITISEIPGAEKRDSYQDKKYYYVYWRMDKEKHTENIEKNKKSALRNYKKFKQAISNDPAEKLSYLVPCLESMERALGLEFVDPKDDNLDLRVEVPKLINEIVSDISMESEKESFR